MMEKSILSYILVLLLTVSCGAKKNISKKDIATKADNGDEIYAIGDDVYEELSNSLEVDSTNVADNIYDNVDAMQETQEKAKNEIFRSIASEYKTYQIQKNDTLMLIAFKLYGDYLRWKEIAELNQDKLPYDNSLDSLTELSYVPDGDHFEWTPDGSPYLILKGDSLSRISKNKYGTHDYWYSLYENNQPMIKDPNLIFAGFTIYCLSKEEMLKNGKRLPASEF